MTPVIKSEVFNVALHLIESMGRSYPEEYWTTSDPRLEVCLFCPHDGFDDDESLKNAMTESYQRYQVLASCRFDRWPETEFLPCEAFWIEHPVTPELGLVPGFLRLKPKGKSIDSPSFLHNRYSFSQRLSMSRSIAKAVSLMHGLDLVHGDLFPGWFWLCEAANGDPQIKLLGARDFGVCGSVAEQGFVNLMPTEGPPQQYRPVELARKEGWVSIWQDPNIRFQPDLWSLAVMVYQLLVDHEGPLPCRTQEGDPFGKYFRPADVYRNTPAWPKHWQDERIKRLDLNAETVAAFDAVFAGAKRADDRSPNRPSADTWCRLLEQEISRRTDNRLIPDIMGTGALDKFNSGVTSSIKVSERDDSLTSNSDIYLESYHIYLVLDGSSHMKRPDVTGVPKHRAVARMVQDLINAFHDYPEAVSTSLTVICWDSNDICEVRLEDYDVKLDNWYKADLLEVSDPWLDQWDPLIHHGGATPTGRALAAARELAQRWVMEAMGSIRHRAFIYLFSGASACPANESKGLEEKELISKFNQDHRNAKGMISLVTVGFFEKPIGIDPDEDKARNDLMSLSLNRLAYFECKRASDLMGYPYRTWGTF